MAGMKWTVFIVLFFTCALATENKNFEDCLRQDSISCMQQHVYRKMRNIFGQDTINLFGGLRLIKIDGARSLEENTLDEKVLGDTDIPERQAAIEDYAYKRISNFFGERSWSWAATPAIDQVVSTARMAISSVPQEVRENILSLVSEGRGKKKTLKSLIPILVLAKMKMTAMAALAFAVISLIAKKALVASVIALAITLSIAIKKLWAKHHSPVMYEVHQDYHHPSYPHERSSLSSAATAGWSTWSSFDSRGAATNSQQLAYSPLR